MNTESHTFDIIIIGAGPAGLAAAIYSSWLGLDTGILEAGATGGKALKRPRSRIFQGLRKESKGKN